MTGWAPRGLVGEDGHERAKRFRTASESGSWRIASLAPQYPAPYVDALYAYDEREHDVQAAARARRGSALLVFSLGKDLRVAHPAGALNAFGEALGTSAAPAHYALTETDGSQTAERKSSSACLARGSSSGGRWTSRAMRSSIRRRRSANDAAELGTVSPTRFRRKSDSASLRERWSCGLARQRRSRRKSPSRFAASVGPTFHRRDRPRDRHDRERLLEDVPPRVRAHAEDIRSRPALRPRPAREKAIAGRRCVWRPTAASSIRRT